tara:strand:+ start:3490 stop:3714 length:225 start_codon:yes stop_codon:yes gene_type:complete
MKLVKFTTVDNLEFAVNPEAVASVNENQMPAFMPHPDEEPSSDLDSLCDIMFQGGSHPITVKGTLDEVVSKLTS